MSYAATAEAYSTHGQEKRLQTPLLDNFWPHLSALSSTSSLPNDNEGKQMHISHGPYARRVRAKSRNVLWDSREVATRYKEVLDATYEGDDSKHKRAAEDHAASPRAAENWFAGDNASSLTGFLNAYHGNPTFKAWARKILLLEEEHDPEFQAQLAAFISAAQRMGT